LGDLDRFRQVFYGSLSARADALFELTDAVLCADGPVGSLVELTLVAEHRRGHGAMYDALGQGRVEPQRLRQALASLPLPQATDGRLMLAVDVSLWLRTDAPTSADRLFCHVYGRGKGQAQLIPAGRTRSWPRWRPVAPPTAQPAGAPKPSRPGHGRPPGPRNHHCTRRERIG